MDTSHKMRTTPSSLKSVSSKLLSSRAREDRTHDAEIIRQEFIKSQRVSPFALPPKPLVTTENDER